MVNLKQMLCASWVQRAAQSRAGNRPASTDLSTAAWRSNGFRWIDEAWQHYMFSRDWNQTGGSRSTDEVVLLAPGTGRVIRGHLRCKLPVISDERHVEPEDEISAATQSGP